MIGGIVAANDALVSDGGATELEITCVSERLVVCGKAQSVALPRAGIVHDEFNFPRHLILPVFCAVAIAAQARRGVVAEAACAQSSVCGRARRRVREAT